MTLLGFTYSSAQLATKKMNREKFKSLLHLPMQKFDPFNWCYLYLKAKISGLFDFSQLGSDKKEAVNQNSSEFEG